MTTLKSNIIIATSEFPPQPGGIGNHAYHLALHLSRLGYKVAVIADQRSKTGDEELNFDATLPFKIYRIKIYRPRFIMYLKRILITFKYSSKATHCIATGKFSLWNVAFCSLFLRIKTIAIVHGTEVNFKTLLLRTSINISLKRFNKIIAVSNYTKKLIEHLENNVVVIPNGINVVDWKNSIDPIALKGNPVLTTVGRVSLRKGQLNIINQLPELIKKFPELHYHCVGIPTEAEEFKSIAESLNVSAYVTFHGSVSDNQLKQFLEATDIFVMLSSESITGDVEGFGIAILEANAMGIPAIGAKGCGIEDAIDHGNSGVLIDLNDLHAFHESISQILKNKLHFETKAVQWANAHDWTNIIKRYEALL